MLSSSSSFRGGGQPASPGSRSPRSETYNSRHEGRRCACSEDPLGLGVDLLEGVGSALVEDHLGGEALIFIVVVCVHAVSELFHIILAELVKNGLTGGALILSGEAIRNIRVRINKV